MIFDDDGIAFPDYQKTNKGLFNRSKNHDLAQWEFVKSKLTNFRTCLDFGAHVGTSAIFYHKFFKQIHSFEPIPELFECLEYNTKPLGNVNVYPVAISNSNGKVDIWFNPDNSGSNVIPSDATEKIIKSRWGNEKRVEFTEEQKIVVDSRTIDSYNFKDVDFIKIDTEGYNIEPLMGMEQTLKNNSPLIQLERSADSGYLEETYEYLIGLDYKLVKTIGNPPDDFFIKS
jgi:FkbM family methyltransferase